MGIHGLNESYSSGCNLILENGERCGQEPCATIHMIMDGHDYQEN